MCMVLWKKIFKNFGHNRGPLGARVPCTKCTQAHARGGGREIHQVHSAWRMSRPRECERSPREAPSSTLVNLVQHTRAPQSTVSTPRMLVNGAPSETWQNEEYVVKRMRICYKKKWRASYKMKRPWGENEKWYGNTKNKTNEPFTNETNVPCPFLRDGVDDNNTVWEIERLKCKMNE